MNINYGKLDIDGTIIYAPRVLRIGKWTIVNPSEARYNQCGYYKLKYNPYPYDEYGNILGNFRDVWVLQDNKLVQTWVEIESGSGEE